MMIFNRSIKNQKDFIFHWKIVFLFLIIYLWYFQFHIAAFLVVSPFLLILDLLPSLYLISSFKKQSPYSKIKVGGNNLDLFDNSGKLVDKMHADQLRKMIGYKPGSHPSNKKWFPFHLSSYGFQHVEIELNDGRVLNITSLYDENIDSIIKQIKPEVYEEKMGLPFIRRKNTFP